MTATLRHDPEIGRRKMLLSDVRGVGFDERAVLRELGDLGWRDGTCIVGVRTLAERMGCGERKIRSALHSLIAQGLIVHADRARPDGSNASRQYRIVWSVVERHQDPQMKLWREESARRAKPLPARRFGRGPLPGSQGRSESGSVSPEREHDNSAACAAAPAEGSSLSLLIREGFKPADAEALAVRGERTVRDAIEAADAQRSRIRNRRGFIAASIRNGWEPPESVVKQRADREAVKRASEAAQAAQAKRLREIAEIDRRNSIARAAMESHAAALGERFPDALRAALPSANTFERSYIEGRLAAGRNPTSIPAAVALVWRIASGSPTTCTEIADHGPQVQASRDHDRTRRRAHDGTRTQTHAPQGGEAEAGEEAAEWPDAHEGGDRDGAGWRRISGGQPQGRHRHGLVAGV